MTSNHISDTTICTKTPQYRAALVAMVPADQDEPERTCRYCRGLQHLKANNFHCVFCEPREGDLIGV